MDILGIGGWEMVVIFVIMLVVAGPQRMIRWSYVLGQYIGKARKMWSETAQMLQKELDAAGVDVKVPNEMPTRGSLNREINKAFNPLTKPLQETMKPIQDSMKAVKTEVDTAAKTATTVPSVAAKPPAARPTPTAAKPRTEESSADDSGAAARPAPSTNNTPKPASTETRGDFGAWSGSTGDN